MQGEILASPTHTKEMILIKQPIGVAALITPVSTTLYNVELF
jgi:acyl-CoA reductase-like NAD-dependent aldehyde dehydrogenase